MDFLRLIFLFIKFCHERTPMPHATDPSPLLIRCQLLANPPKQSTKAAATPFRAQSHD
jgi:hypothetical protein